MTKADSDQVLVIGTGIGGLCTALHLADQFKVLLVCKSDPREGATRYAQGGIASVWGPQDTFEQHTQDTIQAGAGLCHTPTVRLCVEEGPARVKELIEWGAEFTADEDQPGEYDLHREGGHGQRRILHSADQTGLMLVDTLLKRALNHPNIELWTEHVLIELITSQKLSRKNPMGQTPRDGWNRCLGAYLLDSKTGAVKTVAAMATVLATGGAGKVYLYTSNPDVSTGDGIAAAYRAGARVSNLEFMQFHPTCLYHPDAKTFLISEALRGEGAVLKNLDGEEFVSKHHPQGSLAPRDVVARAIDFEMKRRGDRHVWLDATHLGAGVLAKKFPQIRRVCAEVQIDIVREPIPVVPAAHYSCGGVAVDENSLSSLPGLYAVGEVSSTGLHGANRLASNSLLEAIVFAHRAARHIHSQKGESGARPSHLPSSLPEWESGFAVELEEQLDINALWFEIRNLMWNYVGIVRSNERLERARRRLALIQGEIADYYWDHFLTRDLLELRNIAQVGELIVNSALWRRESRGLHYTVDYPERDDRFFGTSSLA